MTEVLSPMHALRRDSLDNQLNYSSPSVDWRAKYIEINDILTETRAELDDFHQSSKELEEELERDLERAEKAQQDLRVKVGRAENERDEWKSKFMSLQTTHNTTSTSLQRELDVIRQENSKIRIQLRDLEMGNDDLERNERAISSSLADVESKYGRVLEEKILLEHELLDKANLEEECQRMKDDLRDANEEVIHLKEQLASAHTVAPSRSSASLTDVSPPSSAAPSDAGDSPLLLEELRPAPPVRQSSDLSLSDLSPSKETSARKVDHPQPASSVHTPTGASTITKRTMLASGRSAIPSPSSTPTGLAKLNITSHYSSRAPHTPISRPGLLTRNASNSSSKTSTTIGTGTATKSKGVQMVSEMRARVKNLEQRIHTRVPRLRMGSVSGRTTTSSAAPSSSSSATPTSSMGLLASRRNHGDLEHTPTRRSADGDAADRKSGHGDSSGWVLIMEDSPSPVKEVKASREKEKQRPRPSSPLGPSSYRVRTSLSRDEGENTITAASLAKSTTRRPGSRVSVSTDRSTSTATTASSIPTPSSRPATPTFLPVPTAGLYSGSTGLKRSTGPGSGAYNPKRSSLGSSTAVSPSGGLLAPSPGGRLPTPIFDSTELPPPNVTVRSGKSNTLSQSRIGRPAGTRKSAGQESSWDSFITSTDTKGRSRSSSTAAQSRSGK